MYEIWIYTILNLTVEEANGMVMSMMEWCEREAANNNKNQSKIFTSDTFYNVTLHLLHVLYSENHSQGC